MFSDNNNNINRRVKKSAKEILFLHKKVCREECTAFGFYVKESNYVFMKVPFVYLLAYSSFNNSAYCVYSTDSFIEHALGENQSDDVISCHVIVPIVLKLYSSAIREMKLESSHEKQE